LITGVNFSKIFCSSAHYF